MLKKLWTWMRAKAVTYDRTCRQCNAPLPAGVHIACSDECREEWESTSAW